MLELVARQTCITVPPSPELLLTGQLSPHTEAAYRRDVREFLRFTGQKPLPDVTKEDVLAFRDYLALERKQKPLTVNRKLTVVSQLFEEAKARGMVAQNPTDRVKRLTANQRESNTPWLSKAEGEALLNAPDLSTLKGMRDRAILAIMLGAGLRRAEVAGMQVGDMAVRDGHHVLTVRGKGGRVDVVKLRVDVWRRVMAWLEASERVELEPQAPVFVGLTKRGRGAEMRYVAGVEKLNAHSLWGLVKGYAAKAGISSEVRPHSLRHSFVTWALEEGASLHKVQYAARHADPRTTERYHRQKLNLDDNAVDYLTMSGGF